MKSPMQNPPVRSRTRAWLGCGAASCENGTSHSRASCTFFFATAICSSDCGRCFSIHSVACGCGAGASAAA